MPSSARSALSTSRRRRPQTGTTNRKPSEAAAAPSPSPLPSARLSASASAPHLTHSKHRKRETATWGMKKAPCSTKWMTESRHTLGRGELHESHGLIDEERERKSASKRHADQRIFRKARDTLQKLAEFKFGSVRNMFMQFDDDGSGAISLDELSAALKKRNLETLFPRDAQRVLFHHIDDDCNEQLEIAEVLEFFEDGGGPLDNRPPSGRHVDKRRSAAEANKYMKGEKHDKKVQQIKDKIIRKVFAKQRGQKKIDTQHQNTAYLLEAFRQMDEDQSGYLSHEEIANALGEKHLNLGVADSEVKELVRAMDPNRDGEVSYKEFIKFMDVHDIDPDYNPFFDSRQAQLVKLTKLANAPWQYQEQTDDMIERFTKLKGQMEQDLATSASLNKPEPVDNSEGMFRATAGTCADGRFPPTIGFGTLPLKGSMRHVESSEDLFHDMAQTSAMQMAAICPRFMKQEPTDWTRVGYGGNGTMKRSGLYAPPASHANTTSNEYYTPLLYVPNQSVSRTTVSDAEKSMTKRQDRLARRQQRTTKNVDVIHERLRLEEDMKFMDGAQKTREKAQAMLSYFKTKYDADAIVERKQGVMQVKGNHLCHSRMWGGSPMNMLHNDNVGHLRMSLTTNNSSFGTGGGGGAHH